MMFKLFTLIHKTLCKPSITSHNPLLFDCYIPFPVPFPPRSLPLAGHDMLIPSFIWLIPLHVIALHLNDISSDKPAYVSLPREVVSLLRSSQVVIMCFIVHLQLPSPWGLLRTTSVFFIAVSSAHHTGQSTIRKYLLHNWPSESPLAKVLFFPSFYFHIISYFQEQFCRWWFLCAFSTFSRALPMQSLLVWG